MLMEKHDEGHYCAGRRWEFVTGWIWVDEWCAAEADQYLRSA